MASPPPTSRLLKFGVFEVDLESGELRKSGMRIKLAGQPFHVLQLLLEHPHQVVTREVLKQHLWPQDTHVEYDLALKRVINRIREVLGDSAESPRFIETIPRMGYRFIAPVEESENSTNSHSLRPAIPAVSRTTALPAPARRGRNKILAILGLLLLVLGVGSYIYGGHFVGRTPADTIATVRASAQPENPVPLIYQPLLPGTVTAGAPSFRLTVNGSGFRPGSVVSWNGRQKPTVFVNSTSLRADISALDIAQPGTASVAVSGSTAGTGSSNEIFFSVRKSPSRFNFMRSDLYVGLEPDSVLVADFNRDGKLDLAVANPGGGTLCVLLGNGDGTFQSPVHYAIGQGPFAQLATGDFNRDGELDLVAANFATNDVSVLLGNGDGTFRTAATYKAGTNPSSVAVADLNGDGKLDLVVANQNCSFSGGPCTPGTVSILLGNGDGTFRPRNAVPAGPRPNGVTVGDFNADGKLDLAVVGGNSGDRENPGVSLLLGNGDGTFRTPVRFPLNTNASSVATADFNGDGKLDLAVADNAGFVSILLGKGDGTFQPRVDYPAGAFPWGSIAIGDFTGDGNLDVAVSSSGANSVTILMGNGDGTFQTQPIRFGTGMAPNGVAIGDFNRNGKLDLAVVARSSNVISIMLQ